MGNWTVQAYPDEGWRGKAMRRAYRLALVPSAWGIWVLLLEREVRIAAMVGAAAYWVIESVYNTFTYTSPNGLKFAGLGTPNPRRGHLSTQLQLFQNAFMLPAMMWLAYAMSFGSVWLFCLIGFPVALWVMEIIQVQVGLRLYAERPWAKYGGKGAMFDGSIKSNMYVAWVPLGLVAYYAWPALVAAFAG